MTGVQTCALPILLFPLSFDLGEMGIFLALLLLPLAGGANDGKRFDAD